MVTLFGISLIVAALSALITANTSPLSATEPWGVWIVFPVLTVVAGVAAIVLGIPVLGGS